VRRDYAILNEADCASTAVTNQIRGFLLERGIAVRRGELNSDALPVGQLLKSGRVRGISAFETSARADPNVRLSANA
jgi:hypothetical protein